MFQVMPEEAADAAEVESLLDRALGPDRHQKTAYRLRDGVPPAAGLSYVARENGALLGSLRFWPIVIGEKRSALLLGPLAVHPAHRDRGIGRALMLRGLRDARLRDHELVILVGDLDYYARVGFSRRGMEGIELPGPVERERLLGRELVPGALSGVAGLVRQAALENAAVGETVAGSPACVR